MKKILLIGTGGTISGIGKKLKELNKSIKIIGVEPYESPLITKGRTDVRPLTQGGRQSLWNSIKPRRLPRSMKNPH